VRIVLTYRGPLPAKSRGNAAVRHDIRRHISAQLDTYWRNDTVLATRLADSQKWVHGQIDGKNGRIAWAASQLLTTYAQCVIWGFGYRMIPLVSRNNGLRCRLKIEIDRAAAPGGILNGKSDLDNQLKTLCDALKMPSLDAQLHGPAGPIRGSGNDQLFCLIEDDSLISEITIRTNRLNTPPPSRDYAEVRIEAETEIAVPHLETGTNY
jgi:hypothetical protein